ncbi:hypothetical protein KEM55_006747, partial [Ascosphaera atra]
GDVGILLLRAGAFSSIKLELRDYFLRMLIPLILLIREINMAPQRPHNDEAKVLAHDGAAPEMKKKKGFSVGPANLPDGTYRRKGTYC